MTDKELIEKIAYWRKHDFGACACLGNCKRCGYHMCHGCLCFVLDELESRADERQAVLAKMEGWLVEMSKHNWGDIMNYEAHEVGIPKGYKRAVAELRAKVGEMKGECQHEWYVPDFGDASANELGTVCKKCDAWKSDSTPPATAEKGKE